MLTTIYLYVTITTYLCMYICIVTVNVYVCTYLYFLYLIGYHMLLEDAFQKKVFASIRGRVVGKGELLHFTWPDHWMVAFSYPPIIVDCQKNKVKFVQSMFVPYLLAVKNLASRYELFVEKLASLTKIVSLHIGDSVDVILEQDVIPTSAMLRYKGNLSEKHSIYFGIEILVSHLIKL